MASIFGLLNTFIPFADPSRPLWRDVLLSALLCTVLYVAPQIDFDRLRGRNNRPGAADDVQAPAGPEILEHDEAQVQAGDGSVELEVPEENEFVDMELEADDGQVPEHVEAEVPEAGPAAGPAAANPHQPRPRDPNREVGAKKAKAIARRNQQRAYNEFMREQGDAQRAEWARDEHERQTQIAADQKRRAEIDAKVREKERQQREARKAKEEAERQSEWEATRTATKRIEERLAEKKFIGVTEVRKAVKRDEEWVHELVRREGIAGTKVKDGEKCVVMLTKSGWLIQVDAITMQHVYARTAAGCDRGDGKVSWQEMGRFAQNIIVSGA